jgi:thioester reductase-like protein
MEIIYHQTETGRMSAIGTVREEDVFSDAKLDPAICYDAPRSKFPFDPRHIFLTGATGLLGAYLLDELLQKTGAEVHCLVRAEDAEAARQRLIKHLTGYELWLPEFSSRVHAVPGDIALPHLGLARDVYDELAAKCDVIFHSAGSTNMAMPYPRLKPTNVGGTEEILRFAGAMTTKPLHYLSTIAIFFTDAYEGGFLRETDTPVYRDSLKGGYSRSKWVSDRLVTDAQDRGLPASVYRPVRILGHSKTGATNDLNDVLPLLLKGCILIGQYPALDIKVTMVPVDFVSEAIVHLARQESHIGKAFHFAHPVPIEWCRLMSMLTRTGYPMKEVAYEDWRKHLKEQFRKSVGQPERRSFLSTVTLAMTAPHFLFYNRPKMDFTNITEGLKGSGIVCPPIDDALISTYVAGWQRSGFLPPLGT